MKKPPLLSTNNAKTIKGNGKGYLTSILYMSPFTHNSKGINVCSHASAGCANSCLVSSGMGGIYAGVKQGRINKTERFLKERVVFLHEIAAEITKAIAKAGRKDAIPVFRLNGTSDLPYEKYRVFEGGKNIFEMFPDVQFYDYTKNYLRFDKPLPANYDLTFSRSETNHNKAMEMMARGVNEAMVIDKLPDTYKGYKVIDADKDDLRFLDPKGKKGVICGLKYKFNTGEGGKEKNLQAKTGGFVIITETTDQKLVKAYKKITSKKAKKNLAVTV